LNSYQASHIKSQVSKIKVSRSLIKDQTVNDEGSGIKLDSSNVG
jgi:hypothetical protein